MQDGCHRVHGAGQPGGARLCRRAEADVAEKSGARRVERHPRDAAHPWTWRRPANVSRDHTTCLSSLPAPALNAGIANTASSRKENRS